MENAVPGGASRGNSTRRKPVGGVGSKNTDRKKTEPIRSNQERSPCSGPAGVQPPPEATSVEEGQHSSQHKAHNLNPPPPPARAEAKRLAPPAERRARVVLH